MAVTKSESHGSLLYFGDAATPPAAGGDDADTLLGEVTAINGPNISLGAIDITDTSSANYKEFLGSGIPDGGELSGTCIADLTLVDATAGNVPNWLTALKAGTRQGFKIICTGDGDEIYGPCYLTGLTVDVGATDCSEKALEINWSLKVDGDVTVAVP